MATSYFVKPGDTLWKIANAYGTTVGDIVRVNPQIKDPNEIFPGQEITIPTTQSGNTEPVQSTPAPNYKVYVVVPGDTLSGIADRFGTSLSVIENANPQITNPNDIFPGQLINVPDTTVASPTPEPTPEPTPQPPLMYDAVGDKAINIPSDAEIVAGYIDGPVSQWNQSDWDRFGTAKKVTITVFGGDADVYDIESGDGTPRSAALWLKLYPGRTLYYSLANQDAIDQACSGLTFNRWVADWTGTPHLVEGSVATQYQSTERFDLSITNGVWP